MNDPVNDRLGLVRGLSDSHLPDAAGVRMDATHAVEMIELTETERANSIGKYISAAVPATQASESDDSSLEDPFAVPLDLDGPWLRCLPGFLSVGVCNVLGVGFGVLTGWVGGKLTLQPSHETAAWRRSACDA